MEVPSVKMEVHLSYYELLLHFKGFCWGNQKFQYVSHTKNWALHFDCHSYMQNLIIFLYGSTFPLSSDAVRPVTVNASSLTMFEYTLELWKWKSSYQLFFIMLL